MRWGPQTHDYAAHAAYGTLAAARPCIATGGLAARQEFQSWRVALV